MTVTRNALLVLVHLAIFGVTSAVIDGGVVKKRELLRSFVHFGSKHNHGDGFVCGGILVTWKHVITAAHCAIAADEHVAYFGARKLHNEDDALLVSDIEAVHSHRKYHENGNINPDIAIVVLSSASRRRMRDLGIEPIPIDWESSALPDGEDMLLMGFGCHKQYTDPDVGCHISRKLRYAWTTLHRSRSCSDWMSTDPRKILCLHGDHGTACGGDSGGPILRMGVDPDTGEEKLVLAGIVIRVVTQTNSKCEHDAPFIGAAMERYRSWMIRKVGRYRRW